MFPFYHFAYTFHWGRGFGGFLEISFGKHQKLCFALEVKTQCRHLVHDHSFIYSSQEAHEDPLAQKHWVPSCLSVLPTRTPRSQVRVSGIEEGRRPVLKKQRTEPHLLHLQPAARAGLCVKPSLELTSPCCSVLLPFVPALNWLQWCFQREGKPCQNYLGCLVLLPT